MSFQDVEKGAATLPSVDSKQDPSQAVAAGIFQINTSVVNYKRLVNTLGTPKDTPELREKLHKSRQHIGKLIKETSAKLKAASEADHGSEVSPGKRVADAKLAKDLQAVLKEFYAAQRTAAERETAYVAFVPQSTYVMSSHAESESMEESQNLEKRALLADQKRQEVLLLENEVVFHEALIEEREQGIREIQQQIGDVNEMFKDLAVLVHEQGVIIDDIDSNIETSHAATVQANRQLAKAAKSQKSNSSLACLILVIFAVVLVIVIVVLAT